MGAKLIAKNETTFAHMEMQDKKDINLHNWRGMRECEHEGIKGVDVITKYFRTYFIPEYTIDMLHEANYCNKTITVPYQFIQNVLSCHYCNGDGKTDWVEAARGPDPKKQRHGYRPNFYRSKSGGVHAVVMLTGYGPDYLVSLAHIHKSEEHCKKCYGSGLQLVDKLGWEVSGPIHLDHS